MVIKSLPEREHENVAEVVNNLVKEGAKLENVTIAEAERKPAYRDGHPGIIVAKCRSKQDRDSIMSSKAKLRSSTQFKQVFIEPYKSQQQRRADANMRAIVNAVGRDKLFMMDSRVLQSRNNSSQNNQQNTNRGSHSGGRGGRGNRGPNHGNQGRGRGFNRNF